MAVALNSCPQQPSAPGVSQFVCLPGQVPPSPEQQHHAQEESDPLEPARHPEEAGPAAGGAPARLPVQHLQQGLPEQQQPEQARALAR